MGASWGFLAAIREPEQDLSHTLAEPLPLRAYLATFPAKLRERPVFARLALVQVLATSTGAAIPFIVPHTTQLVVPESLTRLASGLAQGGLPGLFLLFQTVGVLVFAPLWGRLTDKRGPRRAMRALLVLATLCPLLALYGLQSRSGLWLFLLVYLCFGAVRDAWATVTNYLLEAIPQGEQPTYIALMNVASGPALVIPLVLGFCGSASLALGIAAVLMTIALWQTHRLPETRTPQQI
jgi:MFS family permease